MNLLVALKVAGKKLICRIKRSPPWSSGLIYSEAIKPNSCSWYGNILFSNIGQNKTYQSVYKPGELEHMWSITIVKIYRIKTSIFLKLVDNQWCYFTADYIIKQTQRRLDITNYHLRNSSLFTRLSTPRRVSFSDILIINESIMIAKLTQFKTSWNFRHKITST